MLCPLNTLDESNEKLHLKKRFLTRPLQILKTAIMRNYSFRWNRLFLFCLGLLLGASFAMKWMENDLIYNGDKISIFGLELFYPKEKVVEIFTGIDDKVRTILGYHLSFDFIFMAGCFPGIACLCIMAAEKVNRQSIKPILLILAFLQTIAWVFDIIENYHLLKWLKNPVIGDEFEFYHIVVYSKWGIALTAALFALTILVSSMFKRKKSAI
jgi:hypothetical protein